MRHFITIGLLFLCSCGSVYHPVKLYHHHFTIDSTYKPDSLMQAYLYPFRDSMDKEMKEIVGQTEVRLDSKRPYTSLGNFMTDAFLNQAKVKFDSTADFSIINFGNFRRPSIEIGPITKSVIFELMPFDNSMVLVKANGKMLKRYLEEMMVEGGGLSGAELWFTGKTLKKVFIQGLDIDSAKQYTLVSFDYAASNPAKAWFFSQAERKDYNYLIRDALLDHVRSIKKVVQSNTLEKRIHIDE
ncbi:MAG: 5'-nucleotidase C-terminal domain-containing protein [Chitinophagaceae bacterium]